MKAVRYVTISVSIMDNVYYASVTVDGEEFITRNQHKPQALKQLKRIVEAVKNKDLGDVGAFGRKFKYELSIQGA